METKQARLTIQIDADLKNNLKSTAAANGKSLKDFLLEELQSLRSEKGVKSSGFVTDPTELRELSRKIMELEDRFQNLTGTRA
jgi:hypothetical protein